MEVEELGARGLAENLNGRDTQPVGGCMIVNATTQEEAFFFLPRLV